MDLEKFKNISLFKNMNVENIHSILISLNFEIKKYKRNETIFFRGDRIDNILINLNGKVKAEMQKYNGDIIEIIDIKKYEVFVASFILGEKPASPVDIVAREDSEILFLNKKNIIELIQSDRIFLENFLNEVSSKTQFLSEKIWYNFVNKTIEDKILDYIKQNSKNDVITFLPSIVELSKKFGVTRPSLSRVISDFTDKGYLQKISKNTYWVDKHIFELTI